MMFGTLAVLAGFGALFVALMGAAHFLEHRPQQGFEHLGVAFLLLNLAVAAALGAAIYGIVADGDPSCGFTSCGTQVP